MSLTTASTSETEFSKAASTARLNSAAIADAGVSSRLIVKQLTASAEKSFRNGTSGRYALLVRSGQRIIQKMGDC